MILPKRVEIEKNLMIKNGKWIKTMNIKSLHPKHKVHKISLRKLNQRIQT